MKLTLKRILNLVQCYRNYLLSLCGIVHFTHKPTFLSVEPANFCMLKCPQCPVGMNNNANQYAPKQLLSTSQLNQILNQTADYLTTIQFFFQGEPLLNKNLPQLIQLAKARDLYSIISTNALLLTPQLAQELIASGIDRIIVSIDGISQESYEQYRVGGTLNKALQGLRYLSEEREKQHACTRIELQCLYLKSNEHEWDYIKHNYKRLGATHLSMKTAQFYNFELGNPLMPTDEHYSRYHRQADGTYKRKKPYHNRCLRLWSGCVIDSNGNVLPCCFDKQKDYIFGNIYQQSFDTIWHSKAAKLFRQQIIKGRISIDICLNCTE